ncbi:hypothetical protein JCM17960_19170 [Magnetospira thiophila]
MNNHMLTATATVAHLAQRGPVAVDPDLADAMGAFAEEALSPQEALDGALDGEEADHDAA